MWSIEFAAPNVGAAHMYVEEAIGRGTSDVTEAGRLGWEFAGSQADVERIAVDLQEAGIEYIVTPANHEGHERHALCATCRTEVHRYPPGWAHVYANAATDTERDAMRFHDARPATGTEACACEWDERVAKRGDYN